jgi:hypothetical protein
LLNIYLRQLHSPLGTYYPTKHIVYSSTIVFG